MGGDEENRWHETAWRLNLKADELTWEAIPAPPFQRRAIAAAAHQGKLYVLGGMQKQGGPTRRVDVFNPQSGKWSRGPDLVGEEAMTGFGVSAFATGGTLYASTVSGTLQRLSSDGKQWEVIGRTPTARFFHRLLPLNESELLVVGGANMGIGKFEEIEVLSTKAPANK